MAIGRSKIPPIPPASRRIVVRGLERKRTAGYYCFLDFLHDRLGLRQVLDNLACDNDIEELLRQLRHEELSSELGTDDVRAPRLDLQIIPCRFDERTHAAAEIQHLQ